MTVIPIEFGTPEYDEAVSIRYEILRKPLGLQFSVAQLEKEWVDFHFACYADDATMIGCLILAKLDDKVLKMRQVAVKEKLQGAGVGKALVEASEVFSASAGFEAIELNARMTAVPFYEKLGYEKIGNTFTEVGIEHQKMVKKLL